MRYCPMQLPLCPALTYVCMCVFSCRVARADPFWEVYDTLVMPPQKGRPTEQRMSVLNCVNQPQELTLSYAGPAVLSLSSHQCRLLRDSPQEYQLQVC